MNEQKKMGWTAQGMAGFIFAPTGLLFVLIGSILGMAQSGSVSWTHPEGREIFMTVFCGVGGLFLGLGLIFILGELRRRALLRRAYYSGNRVDAKILGICTQSQVSIGGGHPRMLECAYTDPSGVVHVYRSRYLYTDVSKLLQSDTVPVYIDRDNEKIGFVDVDAVLPEIRIHR